MFNYLFNRLVNQIFFALNPYENLEVVADLSYLHVLDMSNEDVLEALTDLIDTLSEIVKYKKQNLPHSNSDTNLLLNFVIYETKINELLNHVTPKNNIVKFTK